MPPDWVARVAPKSGNGMEHLMENALMARARGSPDPAAYLDAKFPIRRASQVEKIIDGAEGKHEKVPLPTPSLYSGAYTVLLCTIEVHTVC